MVSSPSHNLKLFYAITLLNGVSLLGPVATLFYLHRGLTFAEIFSFLVIIVVTMFFMEVPTGIVADRYGRKTSFLFGQACFVTSSFLFVIARSYALFALAFILIGIGITFFSGADESFIYDTLKEEKKQDSMKKTMGWIWSAAFIPMLIAAPIASFIARDLTDAQFLILLIGGLIINCAALIVITRLTEPPRKEQSKFTNPFTQAKQAFGHIRANPMLLRLFLNKTLILIVGAHVFSYLWQPYLKDSAVPIAAFGWIVAAGAAISWYLYNHLEKIESIMHDRTLLLGTAIIPLILLVAAAFMHSLLLAVILYIGVKVLIDLRNPVFSQYLNDHIQSENRATVLSSLSVIDSACDVIVILSAGFIANNSIQHAFLFSAIVIFAALVLFPLTKKTVLLKNRAKAAQ